QPGVEEPPQFLDSRGASRRSRRVAGRRGRAQGQLVARLGRVAASARRQGGRRAWAPGQHQVRTDRAGAGALRQGACLTGSIRTFLSQRQRVGRWLSWCSSTVQQISTRIGRGENNGKSCTGNGWHGWSGR